MPGKVIVDISVSADGFVTASGRTAAEPLGAGGGFRCSGMPPHRTSSSSPIKVRQSPHTIHASHRVTSRA
jgi:hypothetical protein